MKKILAALFVLFCAPAAAQNYLRDDGIFHSVVEGTTNGQVLVNTGGLLAGTSSIPACATCAVTNATNIFTADQKFSSGTNITIPSGSTYTMSGAIQATGTGGLSVGGWTQFFGGAMFLGTGANNTGIGTLGFPLGSGTVVFNLNSGGAAAVGGCGGSAIDFDVVNVQTLTIGNASAVNNCLLAGMTSYLSTPTFKSNEGRFFYYSGNPTVGGSTTSLIGSLDYAQGMRINLNTTLVFASLTAPLTGTSLQLTQANTTTNRLQMDSYGAANFLSCARSNNTKASPTAVVLDDQICGFNAYGFGTSVQGPAGHVGLYGAGTWSGTSTPTYMDISTTPSASTTPISRVRVNSDGTVNVTGLGTGLVQLTSGALSTLTVGTGVLTALGVNVGSAGAFVTFNGAGGTPSSITLTNGTGLPTTGLTGTLQAAQEPAHTGDVTNSAGSLVLTLATVNANVGTFGSATQVAQATVNAKGLVTAVNSVTITPAASSITGGAALTKTDDTNVTLTLGGAPTTALLQATSLTLGWTGTLAASRGGTGISSLGTGVATALGVNIGSAGAFVTFNGALGTPSSGTVTNLTGTASININGTVGATTPTTIASTTIAASGIVTITNTTDITIPTPYVASGALNVAGGGTFSKKLQVLGGFIFLGDGTNTANNGITAGQVGFNVNGGTSGAAAGAVIDMDSGGTQAFTLGTFGAVTNGLVSGVFDLTPTLKSNKASGDLFRFVKHITNSTISTALTLGTDLSATFGGTVTATTSVTSPIYIGGSGTTGTQLTLQTTTGNGTTDAFAFKGGNNGATTFATLQTGSFNIQSGSTYSIGGTAILSAGATYTSVNDPAGASTLVFGNTGDPTNYFSNTTHTLRNRAASSIFATFTASGLTLTVLQSDTAMTDASLCARTSDNLVIKGTGTLGICLGTSGEQFKTDFAPMKAGLGSLIGLNLQNYRYKKGFGDDGKRVQYGPTAQDVAKVLPDLVNYDIDGKAINYDAGAFLFISLRAIQQLDERVTKLENRK